MFQEFKKWIELILSLVFTALGEFMAWLELEWLQKLYYLLAAMLMVIAIWKLLINRKINVEKLSRPVSIVDQAHDPKKKGEMLLSLAERIRIKISKVFQKGGKKMKEFLKERGWLQWASLGATVVLLVIGILSAFVPELAVVGQNIEAYLLTLGLVATPGILAKGKIAGDAVKNLLPAKERRAIEANIKAFNKKLDDLYKLYEDVILIAKDVQELGGSLTPEQQTRYDTYVTQKNALESKINDEKKKLEVQAHE